MSTLASMMGHAPHPDADGAWRVASARALPLRTPTLPPADATNTILVGDDAVHVVDPATPHEAERERLRSALASMRDLGRRPHAIVLTHHHRDHIGAAAWLRDVEGLPILAHPRTAALLDFEVDGTLDEGDVIIGSEGAHDQWHVLHTPGHAPGHIALWEPDTRTLIGGDLVASVGTIIIDPPEGHMGTYLGTLRRIQALAPRVIIPAHGAPITAPDILISEYLEHRAMREARVFDALDGTPRLRAEVTARAYPELARALLPLAMRSALAHLQHLRERGAAAVDGPELGATSLWRRS